MEKVYCKMEKSKMFCGDLKHFSVSLKPIWNDQVNVDVKWIKITNQKKTNVNETNDGRWINM